jgi:hypothetical protein
MIASCVEVHADAIFQVTAPNPISNLAIPNQTFPFASWEQTIGYSDVNISLVGHGVSSGAAAAYLTTKWGDGTTVADQIAAVTFNAPTGASLPITVFSGLTLSANVYYLMIFADPGREIAWDTTFDATMANGTLGAGVGLNPALLYDGEGLAVLGGSYAPYPRQRMVFAPSSIS